MGTELETKLEETQKPPVDGEQKPEEIPKLDPNMRIQTDQGEVILGEAIKSHFASQSPPAPQFTPEQIEKYEMMEKALAGDAEAGRRLWDQATPTKEEEVIDPKSDRGQILTLQEQVKQLSFAAEQTGRVSKDIVDAANAQQAAQLIAGAEKDFPWLHHHPAGSHKLVQRIERLNEMAQQNNVDPSKPDVSQKIRTAAFQSLNAEIENEMKPFGVTAESLSALTAAVGGKPAPTTSTTATGIVDDQKRGGKMLIDEHGLMNEDYDDGRRFGSDALDGDTPAIRSRFAVTPLGQLIERSTEQLMANAQSLSTGQTRPLRPEDLKGTAAGRQNFEDQGRMSMRGLREQLRGRQEEIG